MTENAKLRLQCKACPWKTSTMPERDIPGGYCEKKHENLRSTISSGTAGLGRSSIHMMACHETTGGAEEPCVGWVINQLGPGNNLALRMLAFDGRFANMRTVGEQHERFEDTLPKKRGRKRALKVAR